MKKRSKRGEKKTRQKIFHFCSHQGKENFFLFLFFAFSRSLLSLSFSLFFSLHALSASLGGRESTSPSRVSWKRVERRKKRERERKTEKKS